MPFACRRAVTFSLEKSLVICLAWSVVVGCAGVGGSAKSDSSEFGECQSGLIDDFEDGNHQLLERDGRGGFWYLEADEEGWRVPGDAAVVLAPEPLPEAVKAPLGHGRFGGGKGRIIY